MSTSITSNFHMLATTHRANRCLAHEARAGRWPDTLPLPRVHAVRRLRLHPGSRCTFVYTIAGLPDTEHIIAKVYAEPRRSQAAADALAALATAGLARDGRHRVPTVIAALPALGLVLTDFAPGVPVTVLLREGNPELAAARAGEWLGIFHATRIAIPTASAPRDPLASAARWAARLARHLPRLHTYAWQLQARLAGAHHPWSLATRVIHGDFAAEHVFIAGEATTVIDWDSCRLGDPAEDAGRFVASLWHLAVRGRIGRAEAIAAEGAFRRAYGASQPAAAVRLSFYAALIALHRACQIAQHDPSRSHQAAALVTAGIAALERDA
jgi:hypothetical protein